MFDYLRNLGGNADLFDIFATIVLYGVLVIMLAAGLVILIDMANERRKRNQVQFYIRIERRYDDEFPIHVFGPYKSGKAAEEAMYYSALIDDECRKDALDCWISASLPDEDTEKFFDIRDYRKMI